MRAARWRAWGAIGLVVAAGLAGCLATDAPPNGPAAYRFPRPQVGGVWDLAFMTTDAANAAVQLTGSTEYARDGTTRTAPVLRVQAAPLPLEDGIHYRSRYWVHQLGRDGVVGTRAEADVVADMGETSSRVEMDFLDGVPDPAHDRIFTNAYFYGVGLWGETLTVGQRREMPEAMPDGWHRETGPPVFELIGVEDGCATVRVDAPGLALRAQAEAVYCEGPLPERIDVHEPTDQVIRLQRQRVGGDLPDRVDQPERATAEVGTFPPDGSELAFPLEAAAQAIRTHPATATWLETHPDGRAVQGRLRATACRIDAPPDGTPSACPPLGEADLLDWEIVLASPDDGGLRVTVRRTLEPTASPPAVVETVPSDRTVGNDTVDEAVPLADALTAVDRVRGDAWKRLAVSFWTHGTTPWWSVYGERRGDDGMTYPAPVNVYWPHGRLEAHVDPLG